jgi:hypothetical protein
MKRSITIAVAIAVISILLLNTTSTSLVEITGNESSLGEYSAIELECFFPEPEIMEVGEWNSISMQDLDNIGEPGAPLLPIKIINVLVPMGDSVKKIVVDGKEIALDGIYNVECAQTPIPLCVNQVEETKPNSTIYESREKFPGELFTIVSTQILAGYKILILQLHPVQYIPAFGTISYFSNMRVKITTAPSLEEIETLRYLLKDEERVMQRVDNPWTLSTYHTSSRRAVKDESSSLVDPAQSYDYVLITNNELYNTFQDLIDWKNSKGVNATMVKLEDIYDDPSYDGVDEADEVRNFIKDAYMNWNIDYILLGGDDEIVPYRGVYVRSGSYTDYNCPCDMYFGALDGTWDNDGDSIYGEAGEEDLYAEVFIGRATVDTPMEVENWTYKTITYEESLNGQLHEALWVGEQLDFITYGGDSKNKILPLLPENYSATTLYDRDKTFGRNAVKGQLNQGKHLVNHLGHASEHMVMGLDRNDVNDLHNTDYYFAYSQGCYAGAFDQGTSGNSEAIAEHFIFTEHGAFAVVMNSRYGWYSMGSTNGPSQYFDYEFFDALFTENIRSLGRANQDSKEDNAGRVGSTGMMRWCYFQLNLLGDPETQIIGDLRPPVNHPKNLEIKLSGENYKDIKITWTDSADPSVTGYDVYRATTLDGEYMLQAADISPGTQTWNDYDAGDGNYNTYFYYVNATNSAGSSQSDEKVGKFVRELSIGRELISIPLIQFDSKLTTVLQTIAGNYDHVQWYDTTDTTDHWKTYSTSKPSGFNDLSNVEHKTALWITMVSKDNLTVVGKVPSSTSIQLYEGWNFVGYASFINRTVEDALSTIWNHVEQVEGFDEIDSPYFLNTLANIDIMTAGNGYWIKVTEDCTWTVEN